MIQLNLFISEVLLPTPIIDSGVLDKYTFKDFINLKPKSPGWYYAYVKTPGVKVPTEKDVLFWSGYSWVDIKGKGTGALYSSIYHMPFSSARPEAPELKEELLSKGHESNLSVSHPGWRTDKPPFPGAYFATNARDPNFNYVKTWDGSAWSNNEMSARITNLKKRMIWFSGKYPSEIVIENQRKRFK